MMDSEIPDSVNIIVLTGGNAMGWKEDLSLEGAKSVRTDCNQVWKMKGSRDGQRGALMLLEEDGKIIMSIDEICGALKESSVDRFDILCFYACLMGSAEETPAAGFVPMEGQYAFGEGSQPLNSEMFSGSIMNTFGKLSSDDGVVELGPSMTPDGSESGGFTLARISVKDIDAVRDVRAEYYLRDIYGNELELTDAITAAEKEPLLKNLAFAEVKAENAAVTVACGDETLEADRDYMVYTKDGEMLIQGIGEYSGSIVLDDEQ